LFWPSTIAPDDRPLRSPHAQAQGYQGRSPWLVGLWLPIHRLTLPQAVERDFRTGCLHRASACSSTPPMGCFGAGRADCH
jgi:hypothetical protein